LSQPDSLRQGIPFLYRLVIRTDKSLSFPEDLATIAVGVVEPVNVMEEDIISGYLKPASAGADICPCLARKAIMQHTGYKSARTGANNYKKIAIKFKQLLRLIIRTNVSF
jgi:hypothetical protein